MYFYINICTYIHMYVKEEKHLTCGDRNFMFVV